jgi:bacteriorhodopsin
MTQDTESILRKSLNEVDRIMKRQIVCFGVLFCAMVGLIVWLGYMCENPATDMRRMILLAVIVLLFGMVYVAMAHAMVQSKTTLKILKAIELLSRR